MLLPNDHTHIISMTMPTLYNDHAQWLILLISPPADYAVKSIKWSPTETVRLHVGIYPYM